MRDIIQMIILIPGLVISAILSCRVTTEIWNLLSELSAERLTGYFAPVFITTAAWMIMASIFLTQICEWKDKKS